MWLSLKHTLDIPKIEDLTWADSLQCEVFHYHFHKEGLAFEEKRCKKIDKLIQELTLWVHIKAEKYVNTKPENIWLSESLPYVCINLLKEFGADCPTAIDVEEAYKFLMSYTGKCHKTKPVPSC